MPALSRILSPFKGGTVVPVVRVSGAIGAAVRFQRGVTLESLAAPLKKAFAIRSAPAVAIVINSPGGSAVQSHLIFRRIRSHAEESGRKVLVFVEDVAASGGYMIAVAGDEIIVDKSSIVGSIGVISASFGFEQLIARFGVERRVYASGDRKSMLDPFLPENPDDVERLKAIQREVHASFVELVRGRRPALASDPDLFSGAFWTGARGVELGLVDRVGDLHTVLRERYGDNVQAKVIGGGGGILRRLGFGGSFASAATEAALSTLSERDLWRRYGL